MKTTIYINNDCIQIAYGSLTKNGITIKEQESIPLQEGTILNGVIFDRDELVAKLKPLRKKLKNVTILIDSSNISTKRLITPKLKKSQMENILKNEFGFSLEEDSFLYDSNVYAGQTGNISICCAVPAPIVSTYTSVFKEAKIRIQKIDVAVNAIIKFIERNKTLDGTTFVLNIVTGNAMLSLLFENGKYLLTNRNRLLHPKGTNEYTDELFSKLSSMVQFNQSQKSDFLIGSSYYLGLSSETLADLASYADKANANMAIVDFAACGKVLNTDYFYPLVAFATSKQDINLYKVAKQIAYAKRNINRKLKIFFCSALVCTVVFGAYGIIAYDNAKLQREIAQYNEHFDEIGYSNLMAEFDALAAHRQEYMDKMFGVSLVLEYAHQANILTKEKILIIDAARAGQVVLELLEYSDTMVTLSGTTRGELESAKFVHRLKDTGLFSYVSYTGYAREEDGRYYFFVDGILKTGGSFVDGMLKAGGSTND